MHTRQGPEVGVLVALRDQSSSEVTRTLPPFWAICGCLVSIGHGAPIWRFCAPIGPKATPLNRAIVAGASYGYAGCVCRCRMVPSAMMSPSGHRHLDLAALELLLVQRRVHAALAQLHSVR
jgi:hypothetical protein